MLNNYPYPGEERLPLKQVFGMLHAMAKMYKPGETDCKDIDPWVCLLKSVYYLLPEGRVKRMWLKYYDINPDPSMDPVGWSYGLHKKITQEIHERKFMSREEFDYMFSPGVMNIQTWSHPTWFMIHYLALRVHTHADALVYKAFISCLQFMLPCPRCRNHLRVNLRSLPIENAPNTYVWSCDLHNQVNRQLQKPEVECDQVRGLYL
jgi:hypothetical protein